MGETSRRKPISTALPQSGLYSRSLRPISAQELCQRDHWVLGNLPDPGPSLPIAQWGRAASSRKSLGSSKLFHLRMEATNLQWSIHLLVPFSRSVPRHNPVLELYGQFLCPHSLVFALTCIVNYRTLYRQVCAIPNHVQSIQCTKGRLQSMCINIKDDQLKPDSPEINFHFS